MTIEFKKTMREMWGEKVQVGEENEEWKGIRTHMKELGGVRAAVER